MEKEICPVTKKDVNKAIQRLADYFQNDKKDNEYFGLDDLGIIDIYLNFKK